MTYRADVPGRWKLTTTLLPDDGQRAVAFDLVLIKE